MEKILSQLAKAADAVGDAMDAINKIEDIMIKEKCINICWGLCLVLGEEIRYKDEKYYNEWCDNSTRESDGQKIVDKV